MEADRDGLRTDSRHLWLGCLLFVGGSAIFYVMPAYLDWLGARLRLDAGELGTLAAAESLGIGITSLLGSFWVRRVDARLSVAVAIVTCLLGNAGTALSEGFPAVLATRFGVGLLGEGVFYTLSFAILGRAGNVDRAFAIALTAAVAFGAASIAGAATLERVLPAFGPLAPLMAIALALAPFVGRLASTSPARIAQVSAPVAARAADGPAALALVAQAVWFAAPGAFWAFAGRIATDNGIASPVAEAALSVGVVASLSGCALSVWQGERWGRLKPIVGATAGMVLAAAVYPTGHAIIWLGVLLSIFYALWNYASVYQLSLVSSLDVSGRVGVMMPAAQVFGMSVGPFCAGWLMGAGGDWAVSLTAIAFAVVGAVLYLVAGGLQRPRHAPRTLTERPSLSS